MNKLTFIKRTDAVSKAGKPYVRLSIKTDKHGERYISGFGNKDNANWQIGDEVDIKVTESETKDKNGLPYLNFEMPKGSNGYKQLITEGIMIKLGLMNAKLDDIVDHLAGRRPLDRTSDGSKMPNFDVEDNLEPPF